MQFKLHMRVPRSVQLNDSEGYVHKFWRCHNKEYLLRSDQDKELYLCSIKETLEKDKFVDKVKMYALCIMDNHHHDVSGYIESSKHLSGFMQSSHGKFGRRFNDRHGRSGKVAEGRPKTPLIQDESHLIKVHLYVEANPIRARKLSLAQLKQYKFSTYRLYAFGIRDRYNDFITLPDWYLRLGKSANERQRAYRRLFFKYLREQKIAVRGFIQSFIGTSEWVEERLDRIRLRQKKFLSSEVIVADSS